MNEPLVLISMLPGGLIHALFVLAILIIVASAFLKKIPLVNKYWIPMRIAGTLLLLFMSYVEGAYHINQKWIEKGKEMQEKVAQAEAKAAEENVKIETQIVEKTKVIKEKGDVVVQYVDRVVQGDTKVIEKDMSEEERKKFQTNIDELKKNLAQCPLPVLIIDMHNEAAKIGARGEKK